MSSQTEDIVSENFLSGLSDLELERIENNEPACFAHDFIRRHHLPMSYQVVERLKCIHAELRRRLGYRD